MRILKFCTGLWPVLVIPMMANCAVAAGVKTLPAGVVVDADTSKPQNFRVGTLSWSIKPMPSTSDGDQVALSATTGKGPVFHDIFAVSFGKIQFAAGVMDPSLPDPQLLVSTFSGGAHCCTSRTVVLQKKGRWKAFALPAGREMADLEFPKDINGDHVPDFVLTDDRFAYQFGCFACSWMPPRVFFFHDGVLVEGSASHKFDALYRQDMAAADAECRKKSNPACAGYAADAARLGKFAEGWQAVIRHYDPEDDWHYPYGGMFEESLPLFLFDNGYLCKDEAIAVTTMAGLFPKNEASAQKKHLAEAYVPGQLVCTPHPKLGLGRGKP